MRFQKSISLLLAVLLLASLLPFQAHAYDAESTGLWDTLTEALKSRSSMVDIREYGIAAADFDALFRQILEVESGMWHVSKSYKRTTSQGIMVNAYFEYIPVKEELAIRSAAAYAVSSCIQSSMSELEKALALHDYLALHCQYDLTYSKATPYDALVSGTSVCQGYAEAYQILMEQVGIPCRVVTSDAMNHAWNQVQIGGQWYHVDVTSDDPVTDIPGRVTHDYFLCSDASIGEEGHYGWTSNVECTDTSLDEGMYWEDVTSAIRFRSDGTVLLRRDGMGTVEVVCVDPEKGTQTLLFENRNSYFTYDGMRYQTQTRGLSEYNGTLYFGDLMKIYSLSGLSGEPKTVCTVADFGDWHYFVSSHVEDDTLYVTVENIATGKREVRTQQLEIPHSHVWGEWEETMKPDFDNNGVETRTCLSCTAEETRSVSNNPFADVGQNNRFKSAILWAYYNGITAGKTATTFEPESNVTRAQFVTFLWRAAGEPEPASDENPFTDLPLGKYYSKAVLWAYHEGIAAGKTATTFCPDDTCTRGQVVLFLYRYAGEPEIGAVENPFEDVGSGNRYYKAIMWAYSNNITAGKTATTFGINTTCVRSHVVTFLYRYLA